MMKSFLFLLLLAGIASCRTAKNENVLVIEEDAPTEYQEISGTKISMIPPKGFTKATNFFGLQQTESGSSIMVVDIPGPYTETSQGITKENLLSRGVEVAKIEELTIEGLPGMLVTGTQNAQGKAYTKYILVFGTEKETIIINGVFPENIEEMGIGIKKAMLGVRYAADKVADPFEALDYTLDVSATKLKFAKSMSNSLIYTVDGQVPTQSDDKTNLIVSKSFSEVAIEDRKLFVINRLKQTPMEIDSIEYTNEITIDGVSGYEILAKGKSIKAKEAQQIYQVILFSDNLYYIIMATTNDLTGASMNEVKTAIKTFKRK